MLCLRLTGPIGASLRLAVLNQSFTLPKNKGSIETEPYAMEKKHEKRKFVKRNFLLWFCACFVWIW